ncbi:MAG: GNAT family N-acetyltransferase [Candidatus Competibacteraceae bacterium]|nr:GNAT family N-acetyltransferase [Candidatus Competibacteraceae bacterium]MCB1820145.1 GNAT family N-acetyltransferase [Candidatus Competibacteraceae bacterium]HRY15854.1 GNAT family N-acetyltransferase [Candidatus Competibacteraceae bacterium]
MNDEIRIACVTGADLDRFIPEVARLRITVFRDYPYLYDGDLDYEARYLRTYSQAHGSVVVLALDGERVIGASTALPLTEETDPFKAPFLAHGYDPAQVFYLGESVLLPDYRGHGVGVRFFTEREQHARALAASSNSAFGPLRWLTFCAVERPADDPRRPPDYIPLDAFWRKRGYTRQPGLRTEFSWKELGETVESPKPMVCWLKEFSDHN